MCINLPQQVICGERRKLHNERNVVMCTHFLVFLKKLNEGDYDGQDMSPGRSKIHSGHNMNRRILNTLARNQTPEIFSVSGHFTD
jgi:hypothetical protein